MLEVVAGHRAGGVGKSSGIDPLSDVPWFSAGGVLSKKLGPRFEKPQSGPGQCGMSWEADSRVWGAAMEDLGYELPRIPIPRTGVKIALATVPFSRLRGGPARVMDHLGE